MLNECYSGRKAIRTFLLEGKLRDVTLPPLRRIDPAAGRRPERPARARPNAAARRQKYYGNLHRGMSEQEAPGLRPAHRTTKTWDVFAPQVREGRPIESRRYPRTAAHLRAADAQSRDERSSREPAASGAGVSAASGERGASAAGVSAAAWRQSSWSGG